MMSIKELREKSEAELAKLLRENKAQAHESYIGVIVKQEKTLKSYHNARTMIARIATILKEKTSKEGQEQSAKE